MLHYHTFSKCMRIAQRIFLIFCVIFMISGVALAADRDVIIGFQQPVGLSEKALIHDHGGIAKKSFHLIPAIAGRVPENNIEKLKKNPRVAYVEDDIIFEATTDEYTSSWGVQHIGSHIVYDNGITGAGVKIAVLDTGIDYNHEDLDNNYKGGIGFVQDVNGVVNPSNYDDSTYSHGTHVGGIIAAENNGIGVVGVAPNAEIYAIKVLDGAGFGISSWIISGIEWAVENDMDIVTMSIEGSGYSQSLQEACDSAYNSGLLLVAAGGNSYGGGVRYPAAFDSVIAVTATDADDQQASFSSIGPEIELAAPGVGINSTIKGGDYGYLSGTSTAAPHVTGVAALILSSDFQDANGDGVKNNSDIRILLHNAIDLGTTGRDNIFGYGLVDAQKAVLGIDSPNIIKLPLIRTISKPVSDSKNVTLSQGNYLITIINVNLSKIEMNVYENGVLRKDLSSKYKFNKSNDVNLELNVNAVFDIMFVPYGYPNSVGYVTITKQ
jgi:subtilisin